jgi:hypothetical protein
LPLSIAEFVGRLSPGTLASVPKTIPLPALHGTDADAYLLTRLCFTRAHCHGFLDQGNGAFAI